METLWSGTDGNNRRAQSSTYLLPPKTNKGNVQKPKIETTNKGKNWIISSRQQQTKTMYKRQKLNNSPQHFNAPSIISQLSWPILGCLVQVWQMDFQSLHHTTFVLNSTTLKVFSFFFGTNALDTEACRNEVNMIFWSTMGFTLCGETAKIFQRGKNWTNLWHWAPP